MVNANSKKMRSNFFIHQVWGFIKNREKKSVHPNHLPYAGDVSMSYILTAASVIKESGPVIVQNGANKKFNLNFACAWHNTL